jgi:hypothetical protein
MERIRNQIIVEGELKDFHRFLSFIHAAIEKAEYQEIVLNFENCTSAFQGAMLAICAQVMAYRQSGIDFDFIPPTNIKLLNLFRNTGWGYLLDPHKFDPSNFRGHTRIPATQYRTSDEQQSAVNKIVNVILGAIPDMQRSDFAAFEWSVNEITDNVLVHSQSSIGGLVQVSVFEKNKKQVQFVVADAGIGIPVSLREGHPDISSDTDALDKAIREGVTRDKKIGQGNGLFGSFEICSKSEGYFAIHSGHACLEYSKRLSISNERIPYGGTLIIATIDFSRPHILEDALRIKGEKYRPVDFVETEYERNSEGKIIFYLSKESNSFGSRVAGKPIRIKLSNLLHMGETGKIYIDLEGIPIMSSSFADEAFGKLFLEAGPMVFMQKFEFVNVMEIVQLLINKAIGQRMAAGVLD